MPHRRTPNLIIQGFMAPTISNLGIKMRLRLDGHIAHDIPLPKFNTLDVRKSAEIVRDAVDEYKERYRSEHINLIGISLGGLVGLQYIRKLAGSKSVKKFITLGSPFYGTQLAHLMKAASFGNIEPAKQMVPNSDFLQDLHLERTAEELNQNCRIYSLHDSTDAIVPPESARLEGAEFVSAANGVWPLGHYTPLFLKKDYNTIKEIIARPH